MALPAAFLDELRARTPLAAVIARRVRLARSGRQWKGCCPFHGEKTPSFYVYDDHFHCFGCGAHGDAISFVMQSQGAAFPEAVAQLAAEAGLDVPKPNLEAAAAERRRADLHEVLDAAATFFQRRLFQPDGRPGLDYLRRRGLDEATIRAFGLGWSGDGRGALTAELATQGIDADRLAEAGLLRPAEPDSGPAREFFFGRIMFPIRDRQARMVSFGGRVLGDGQPKYLNGPETALFAKRRSLYGLDRARAAVRDGAALVVVEGYMDVIALHQAGFGGAVAPLGTALTEEQLTELWRLSPTPVLCFDGDAAGARAVARVAELALPSLAVDRRLTFMAMPADIDPDTFVRRNGAAAFAAALDGARPFVSVLFDLVSERTGRATPEARAALYSQLADAARGIADKALAREYRDDLLDRFFAERRARRGGQRPRPDSPPRPEPSMETTRTERARILGATLLVRPDVIPMVDDVWSAMVLPRPLELLRAGMLQWTDAPNSLDTAGLIDHLGRIGLEEEITWALSMSPLPLPGWIGPAAAVAEVAAGWWHIFGFLNVNQLRDEVIQAERDFAAEPTSQNERRLVALKQALNKVLSGEEPDDIGVAA